MSAATDTEQPVAGRSARKRQAILHAARDLFLQKGYAGTSMDEVAAHGRGVEGDDLQTLLR